MKISVCMATYNGAKHIKKQLDSILHQDLSAFPSAELEIIISDDGSTDNTVNIIEGYNDNRIRLLHHRQDKTHRYHAALYAATANFGYAMSHAAGDYIFLSDQDDVWYPDKISKTLQVLTDKGGVVATAFDLIDEHSEKIIGDVTYSLGSFWKPRRGFIYGFSCGITREEMRYILPMPDVPQHDIFIHLLAQKRNKLHVINSKCAAHRWGGDNTSNSANEVPVYVKIISRLKIYAIVLYRTIFPKHDSLSCSKS